VYEKPLCGDGRGSMTDATASAVVGWVIGMGGVAVLMLTTT
jgi:hypothetical protein